jgi:hypothetical protein
MFETNKDLRDLNLENSDLLRLPACSPALRDEVSDFDIRISGLTKGEWDYFFLDSSMKRMYSSMTF